MVARVQLDELARLISGWCSEMPEDLILTPDSIAEHARGIGVPVKVEPISDWHYRTDADLYAEMELRSGPFFNEVVLVTEASFDPGVGAFRFPACDMPSVMANHADQFEPVFNGDVVLVILGERRIVCVHHENYLVVVGPFPFGTS